MMLIIFESKRVIKDGLIKRRKFCLEKINGEPFISVRRFHLHMDLLWF
mgnify:CR=1 FL=1